MRKKCQALGSRKGYEKEEEGVPPNERDGDRAVQLQLSNQIFSCKRIQRLIFFNGEIL